MTTNITWNCSRSRITTHNNAQLTFCKSDTWVPQKVNPIVLRRLFAYKWHFWLFWGVPPFMIYSYQNPYFHSQNGSECWNIPLPTSLEHCVTIRLVKDSHHPATTHHFNHHKISSTSNHHFTSFWPIISPPTHQLQHVGDYPLLTIVNHYKYQPFLDPWILPPPLGETWPRHRWGTDCHTPRPWWIADAPRRLLTSNRPRCTSKPRWPRHCGSCLGEAATGMMGVNIC